MAKLRGHNKTSTVYAGNWAHALRAVPGMTKVKRLQKGIEVPEEPIEVSSTQTGRYKIRYVQRR